MAWLLWIVAVLLAGVGLAGLIAVGVRLGANLIEARVLSGLANLGAFLLLDHLAPGVVVQATYALVFATTAGIAGFRIFNGWPLDAIVGAIAAIGIWLIVA